MNREKENRTNQEAITHRAKVEPGVQRSTRETRGESIMNSRVRIVKRRSDEGLQSEQAGRDQKSPSHGERDIASTVKGWIAEREQRRRTSERRYWDMLVKFAQ